MAVRASDSTPPLPPAGEWPIRRGRRRSPALGRLLTFGTVAASGLWGPVMLLVAHAIRPAQLTNITAYPRTLLEAVAADARQRIWTIVIATFLALLALATAAIVLNRGAARVARGEPAGRFATLRWWASGGMLFALVLAVVLTIVLAGPSLSEEGAVSLYVFAMAGAMAGVILGATAVHRAVTPSPGDAPERRRKLRQLGARVGLVLAALLLLAGFVVTALAAQFLAAFLLFLVY